jgi:hypothetical protein
MNSITLAKTRALLRNVFTKNYAVPDTPFMPERNVNALAEAMRGAACYLEYGAGGSTVLASEIGVPNIVSIESDRAWRDRVSDKVAGIGHPGLNIVHVDIGPTKRLGYPRGDAFSLNFRNYPQAGWRRCGEAGLSPDLVLIDGRFRLACILAALLNAKPGCKVLLDDYRHRRHYHRVERFAEPIRMIGRMAEFMVAEDLPHGDIEQALEGAVLDPR